MLGRRGDAGVGDADEDKLLRLGRTRQGLRCGLALSPAERALLLTCTSLTPIQLHLERGNGPISRQGRTNGAGRTQTNPLARGRKLNSHTLVHTDQYSVQV